jgi:membrane associated rhomboid family serine protease
MLRNLGPVTRALLFANVAIFALQSLLPAELSLALALWPGGDRFEPWQLVSYAFLHGGIAHLAFNMLGLVTFGDPLERAWGGRRFLGYYLASVVAAGLTQIVVSGAMAQNVPTVGASGGVYGLLLGFAVLFPAARIVLLIPPIPLPARVFALLFAGLELVLGVTGTSSGVAHFAHLGGMLGGAALLLLWRRRYPSGP